MSLSRVFLKSIAAAVLVGFGLPSTFEAAQAQQPARSRPAPAEPSPLAWISRETEREMLGTLQNYEAIVARGGWPVLPDRITLRYGDSDSDVAILRARLKSTGDLPANARDNTDFDDGVESAVKRFQLRHGLEPTGVVYGITLRTLNVPAAVRLDQLRTNLGRLQELLPRLETTPRYMVMNAASFELQGISNGTVEVTSRSIVGKRTTPTPVVSASVQAINLLPYWHVPGTIAKAALIPAMRKDPAYLTRERIRVFSSFGGEEIDPARVNWFGPESERYVFRQDPGPHNALGLLRLDMPNKHIVYMHDTPMKPLFNAFERAYSAGCVRLQSYQDVAAWITNGQDGWTRERIAAAVEAGQAHTIKLARPVPVHFIYLTSWVQNGVVHFRNDLYNRDDPAADGGDSGNSRVAQSIAP